MDTKCYIMAGVGTGLSVIGTALSPTEILQIISLCLTILGTIISFIVIPIVNWYKRSKADKRIDQKEIEELIEIIEEGTRKSAEEIDRSKKSGEIEK